MKVFWRLIAKRGHSLRDKLVSSVLVRSFAFALLSLTWEALKTNCKSFDTSKMYRVDSSLERGSVARRAHGILGDVDFSSLLVL